MRNQLTPKRRNFAKEYVMNGENGTEAAKKSFDVTTDNSAAATASRALSDVKVQQEIEKHRETLKSALVSQGITPQKIAKRIDYLLDDEDGILVDKGLKHALSIHGVEEEKPQNHRNNYTFIFNDKTQEEIKKVEAIIKQKLLNHAEESETSL